PVVVPVVATVRRVLGRVVGGQPRAVGSGGQPSGGTPAGGSPTSSRSRTSRRCPTMRYAGPSARGPTSTPTTPAAASAAPTASHAGSSLGPSARVYMPGAATPVAQLPAAMHHHRSRPPSSDQPG